jgi:hypothetical protein
MQSSQADKLHGALEYLLFKSISLRIDKESAQRLFLRTATAGHSREGATPKCKGRMVRMVEARDGFTAKRFWKGMPRFREYRNYSRYLGE